MPDSKDNMTQKLKVTALQMDLAWASPEANAAEAQRLIFENEGSDLYVLPEMWSTGFATEPKGIAEVGGKSLRWMQDMAQKTNAAIAGSVATEVGEGDYRNRFYFVKPNGEVTFYDKHHLFTYGGEHLRYTPGNERTIVEYKGVRFMLRICYDLRFPLWNRNREDYDCALFVASWPTPRVEAWRTLLRARAIENQCYLVGVNRVGTDPACQYCGGTALINPYGETIAECERGEVGAVTTEIDMKALEAFRMTFPVLKDCD